MFTSHDFLIDSASGSLVIHGDGATLFGPIGKPVPATARTGASSMAAPIGPEQATPPTQASRSALRTVRESAMRHSLGWAAAASR